MNVAKMSLHQLESEIRKHNHLYWVKNKPVISDQEYDKLIERLRKLDPKSNLLKQIGDGDSNFGKPVKHQSPMLSMNKAYSKEDIEKWAKGHSNELIASPKMDGTACSIVYEDGILTCAATRGNGEVGEDVTDNIKRVSMVPTKIDLKGRVEVRGEVVMPISVFEKKFKSSNSNPRNLAAGSLKQKNADITAERGLVFYAYNIIGTNDDTEQKKFKSLRDNGFLHVEAKYTSLDKIEEKYEYFINKRDDFDFEIDGVIFTFNDLKLHENLGSTSHHPRYAIAWKIAGEMATTKLLDVDWSISRTGTVTPVAIVEPVKLSGAMTRKASLHNLAIMKNLGLTKGCIVEMSRRGMVIPQVERVVKPGKEKIEIPKEVDGYKVHVDGDFLRLKNPNDSSSVVIGRIRHFVNALDIDGFGDRIIKQLYEKGLVESPEDLYDLTEDMILDNLERMGEKSASNLVEQIQNHKQIALPVLLSSLGIDALGRSMSKKVAKKYQTIDNLMKVNADELSQMDGVAEITAKKIINGLKTNKSMIEGLIKRGVKIIDPTAKSGPLKGKSFVFTGTMESMGRKDAQKKVEALGGDTPSSVSKDLTYLVVGGNEMTSSKCKKAQKLGVRILDEDAFLKLIN